MVCSSGLVTDTQYSPGARSPNSKSCWSSFSSWTTMPNWWSVRFTWTLVFPANALRSTVPTIRAGTGVVIAIASFFFSSMRSRWSAQSGGDPSAPPGQLHLGFPRNPGEREAPLRVGLGFKEARHTCHSGQLAGLDHLPVKRKGDARVGVKGKVDAPVGWARLPRDQA